MVIGLNWFSKEAIAIINISFINKNIQNVLKSIGRRVRLTPMLTTTRTNLMIVIHQYIHKIATIEIFHFIICTGWSNISSINLKSSECEGILVYSCTLSLDSCRPNTLHFVSIIPSGQHTHIHTYKIWW